MSHESHGLIVLVFFSRCQVDSKAEEVVAVDAPVPQEEGMKVMLEDLEAVGVGFHDLSPEDFFFGKPHGVEVCSSATFSSV